jgi:hypothetical protein
MSEVAKTTDSTGVNNAAVPGKDTKRNSSILAILAAALGVALCIAGFNLGRLALSAYPTKGVPETAGFWGGIVGLIGARPFITAGILTAAAKDAMNYLPAIRKMYKRDRWGELWAPSVAVFFALFAVGFGFTDHNGGGPEAPGSGQGTTPQVDQTPSKPGGSITLLELGPVEAYRPVDPKQGLMTLAVSFPTDNLTSKSTIGLEPEPDAQELLRRIGRALVRCTADGVAKPRVLVVGFASHKGPLDDPPLFQQANLTAAKTRAENVSKLIEWGAREEKPNGDAMISVEILKWANYEQMEHDLRFQDLVDRNYDDAIGNFTRRAEIRIMSAGRCEVHPPAAKTDQTATRQGS